MVHRLLNNCNQLHPNLEDCYTDSISSGSGGNIGAITLPKSVAVLLMAVLVVIAVFSWFTLVIQSINFASISSVEILCRSLLLVLDSVTQPDWYG